MIKAVVFDFDGVILESADLKTCAFRELFKRHCPQALEDAVEYHRRNMGVSRYVKFRHIFKTYLGRTLSAQEEEALGREFEALVLKELDKVPFVNGVLEFLKNSANGRLFFVASGTPQEELLEIASRRKVSDYFKEICGSPEEKKDIIGRLLKSYALTPQQVLFIGDAESDLRAATATGVHFVGRIGTGGLSEDQCKHTVRDLSQLAGKIRELEKETRS